MSNVLFVRMEHPRQMPGKEAAVRVLPESLQSLVQPYATIVLRGRTQHLVPLYVYYAPEGRINLCQELPIVFRVPEGRFPIQTGRNHASIVRPESISLPLNKMAVGIALWEPILPVEHILAYLVPPESITLLAGTPAGAHHVPSENT